MGHEKGLLSWFEDLYEGFSFSLYTVATPFPILLESMEWGRCGEGAFMAARVVHRQGRPRRHQRSRSYRGQTGDHKGLHTISQMASPTTPHHPRPYRILGWRLRLIPIGRSLHSPRL